jgi:hypothetical protein
MHEQEEMISSSIDPNTFHQILKLNLLNDFEVF